MRTVLFILISQEIPVSQTTIAHLEGFYLRRLLPHLIAAPNCSDLLVLVCKSILISVDQILAPDH